MNTKDTHNYTNNRMVMDQFGRRVAARLDVSCNQVSHDISERLRVARLRAVQSKKSVIWEAKTAPALQIQGNSASMSFDFFQGNLWNQIASLLPIIALVVGVFLIYNFHDDKITSELAEVDAKLLLDDLPPTAYTDPGFLKFLQLSSSAVSALSEGIQKSSDSASDTGESSGESSADQDSGTEK
jgi:hypothetical protein